MDHICDMCYKFSVCDDKCNISSSEDNFNYIPGPNTACSEAFKIYSDLSNSEAITELKRLEFYGRPFDNTPEESNKANRKTAAIAKAIEALQKLDHIQYILNYRVSR